VFEFNSVWDKLAERGHCDARGSMEYHRVYNKWLDEGRTIAVRKFIIDNANAPAPPRSSSAAKKGGAA